jgi:hypothetical protein
VNTVKRTVEATVPKVSIEVSPSVYFTLGLFWKGRGRALPLNHLGISTTEFKTFQKSVRRSQIKGRDGHFEKIKRDQIEGIIFLQ